MASKKVKISANQALNATNKVLNSMTEISDHYVAGGFCSKNNQKPHTYKKQREY